MAQLLDAQRLPAGRRREDVEVARQLHHHPRAAGDEKFGGQWHGRVCASPCSARTIASRSTGRWSGCAGAGDARSILARPARAGGAPTASRTPMWSRRAVGRSQHAERASRSSMASRSRRAAAEVDGSSSCDARRSWALLTTRRRDRVQRRREAPRRSTARRRRPRRGPLDARAKPRTSRKPTASATSCRHGHRPQGRARTRRPARSSRPGRLSAMNGDTAAPPCTPADASAARCAMRSTRSRPTRDICHCRMCQKAFGSFFAPLDGVPQDDFT